MIINSNYNHSTDMLFGERPSFEEILKVISRLEDEINNQS